jgi:HlyD family secretion protein
VLEPLRLDPLPAEPALPPRAVEEPSGPAPPAVSEVRPVASAAIAETLVPDVEGAQFASGTSMDDPMGRSDAANVEIRSEELDEILSAMPGGLLRWGISGVFLTLMVLLGVSWYIAYPDVVTGRIALTTLTPPVRLVARTGGEVARVFAADGARVRAGDPLVLMKNPAELADVRALTAALAELEPALRRNGRLPDLSFGRQLALGSLQPAYSALQQAVGDYRLAQDEQFYAQKLSSARAQVADLETMRGRLEAQQALVQEQLGLSDRARARTRQLVQRGLAAPADVDKSEEDYLQKRYAVETGRTALTSNEVQLANQRSALLDLEQRRSDDGQRGLVSLRNAHHAMQAAITGWEQENLLRAPVAGTVSYFRELHENQYAGAAEPILAVVPSGSGLVGRVTLNGNGAGKVEAGQRVIIRFESYPYHEYGTVEGRVVRVSQLGYQADTRAPEMTTYQVEVSMPKGLVTSYGRHLEFRQEMRGDVDVVTQDMRMLQRIFNKIRAVGSKN